MEGLENRFSKIDYLWDREQNRLVNGLGNEQENMLTKDSYKKISQPSRITDIPLNSNIKTDEWEGQITTGQL